MKVVKELVVRYEDEKEYKYDLGDGGYRIEEGRAHLKLWKNGCTYSIHYFEDSGKYRVKEYYIRNVVVREGEDTPSPANEVETFKYVCIILNSGNTVEYKGASVELRENTIEVFREGLSASFFLRDVSGWELREE